MKHYKIKKTFHVNISFEKEKKQEGKLIIDRISEKLPLDNDDIYVKYNPEVNSYELKTDHKNDEKEYII